MLFADHLGKTGKDIKKEIEDRGGVWNGYTSPERTFYFVHIKNEHALFALEWLYHVVSPHEMAPDVVERERRPVEVEVGAKPREALDWIDALYINPVLLRLPDFWETEFGLAYPQRDWNPYRSLHAITPEELRQFYDRYYSPAAMTVTVIGDLDRADVFAAIDKTFQKLEPKAKADTTRPVKDAGRSRSTYDWGFQSDVSYTRRFRFATYSGRDEILLRFVGDILGKRLNDLLRFGERKSVYGLSAGLSKRGPAGFFYVSGRIKPDDFEYARKVIDDEIQALGSGSLSDKDFEADRSTIIQQLRVSNSTPAALESWVANVFNDRDRWPDFPDLISEFQNIRKAEVAAFVTEHFQPEREYQSATYPSPVSQLALGAMAIAFLFAAFRMIRYLLIRPVDMKRIRYVARFRIPRALYLGAGAVWLVALAIVLRLVGFLYEIISVKLVVTQGSVFVQWSVYALMAFSMLALVIAALSLVPSKLLLFDDRLLIKYFAYRSVSIPLGEIEEVSLTRFPSVWLGKRILKCVPLKFAILSPGIYLRRRRGWNYFFDVRDRVEFSRLLDDLRGAGSPFHAASNPR
jgi:predicted Zn-dependent peptidase